MYQNYPLALRTLKKEKEEEIFHVWCITYWQLMAHINKHWSIIKKNTLIIQTGTFCEHIHYTTEYD